MFVANENDFEQLGYEKNNHRILINGGVQLYFSNVFDQTIEGRVPTIKRKLRKILVDFCLCQTCMEINQSLGSITIWYQDPKAKELKEFFVPLRRDNKAKESQAIEINIDLEGSLCSPLKVNRGIKSYPGLTKLIYQEFIEEPKSSSMLDDNPYDEMKTIIRKGNLAPTEPLSSILAEGVD